MQQCFTPISWSCVDITEILSDSTIFLPFYGPFLAISIVVTRYFLLFLHMAVYNVDGVDDILIKFCSFRSWITIPQFGV